MLARNEADISHSSEAMLAARGLVARIHRKKPQGRCSGDRRREGEIAASVSKEGGLGNAATLAITTPRHQPSVKEGFLEASS